MPSWTATKQIATSVAFVLQGNAGAGYVTIPATEYLLDRINGRIYPRTFDGTTPVNWLSYTAFRASGAVYDSSAYTTTPFTNQSQTFGEIDETPMPFDPWTGQVSAQVEPAGVLLTGQQFTETIASDNFAADSSGWQIKRSGNAEFNNVTVRGTIYASAGEIAGWTINTSSLTGGNATLHKDGYLTLGTSNDILRADASDSTYRLWIGHASAASATFRVTKGGVLTATGATISGTLTATAGTIGGWTVGASTLTGGNATLNSSGVLTLGTSNDVFVASAADSTYRLWIGNASAASATFNVTKGGVLTATGATISGTLTATAGAIGGFSIGSDYIRDAADTFGLASTATVADDVRLWVGAAFASRTSAPLQIYESGLVFAKDIVLAKGQLSGASGVTGYGYAVGDPLLLLHFDGAKPFESDYRGSMIGHKGQAGTYTWGGTQGRGMFRPGKFNKAVQVAEATTNLVTNPSFEVSGTTSWSTVGTWATNAQSSEQSYFGGYSCKLVNSSGSDAYKYITFTATATTTTVSIYVYRSSGTGTIYAYLQLNASPFTIIDTTNATATTGEWQRIVASGATSIGTVYRLGIAVPTGNTVYIDGAQAEGKAYVTPYCDGSLGLSTPTGTTSESGVAVNGHSWSGTQNASSSSRTAALIAYPSSGSFLANQGTLSLWYYEPGSTGTFPALFGWRIDSDNYFAVERATSTQLRPYVETKSGGTGATTSTSTTDITEGWHHLVVTWNNGGGSGSLKMYIDGVQYGSITAAYVTPVGTVPALEIGSFNSAGQANTYIDDVCILGNVLSENEIKSIYYSEAPLMVGVSNQEFRLSGAGLGDVFGNANGLFARGADGTPSFGLVNGAVNTNTWGGANETLAAGDFMFGSNLSNMSNIFWDASTGRLNFRGATTTQLYIDTDGSLVGGGGVLTFNSSGLAISTTTSSSDLRSLQFKSGSTTISRLQAYTDSTLNFLGIKGDSVASKGTVVQLLTDSPTGQISSISMQMLKAGVVTGKFELLDDGSDNNYGYISDVDGFVIGASGVVPTDKFEVYVSGGKSMGVTAAATTLSQGANDTPILILTSTDVGHDMSDFGAVTAFGNFGKVDGSAGGLEIRGLRDEDGGAGNAIRIRGFLNEAANTTHNGSGLAIVDIAASVTDGGTGAQVPAANSNLVSISSHNSIKFLFDADGDAFNDGTGWTAYDSHDDIGLLNMLNTYLLAKKGSFALNSNEMAEAIDDAGNLLKALKLVQPHAEGAPFINQTKLTALSVGAIRQMAQALESLGSRLNQRIEALETAAPK